MKQIEKAWVILKSVMTLAMWGLYFSLDSYFRPIWTSQMALGQMESSNSNLVEWNMWKTAWEYAYIPLVLITIVVFWKEIKKLIERMKGEI